MAINAVAISYPSVTDFINSTLLAVELNNFSAEIIDDKYALLSWSTETEVDNDRFEIEKSEDGLLWSKVGQVKGNGTSGEALHYTFQDRSELKPIAYYRITDVDYSGIRTHSKTISVASRIKMENIRSFPNPISDRLFIPDVSTDDIITLTALDGRTISKEVIGTNLDTYELDMNESPQGIYLLTIQRSDVILTSKVIKQ